MIGLVDALDIVLVTLLLWGGVVWLRHSRARLALLGIAILAAVYLGARRFGLELLAWMLQGFFAVSVLVLVVVFQDDLRRLFEQVAVFGLRRRPRTTPGGVVDVLARVIVRMAESRTGALFVIPGREPLDRHLEGGVTLDARPSEPLFLSIFDTSSPGHDGAVVLAGDRVARFAVHLPLSGDRRQLGQGGTRHAAALGLAERTDALCIAVSEERGTVSVARDGRLRVLRRPEQVARELQAFVEGVAPKRQAPASRFASVARRWPEAAAALGIAFGLWLLLGPGSSVVEVERSTPVIVENLPEGYALESVEPPEVQVRLAGRRRDLVFSNGEALRVEIDAFLVQLGRRTFRIGPDVVRHPEDLRVVEVEPDSVKLSVRRTETRAPADEP